MELSLADMLFQAGMVGIFIIFVIITRKSDSEREDKRTGAWQETLEKMAAGHANALTQIIETCNGQHELLGTKVDTLTGRTQDSLENVVNTLNTLVKTVNKQNIVLTALATMISNGKSVNVDKITSLISED